MEKESEGKNFRWSKPMYATLLEILAEEALKGNKPSNTFKPGSFAKVAKDISEKFVFECKTNYVENRLKTIKTMWTTISKLKNKSGFGWDDEEKMITCPQNVYNEEVGAHPIHEQYLNKKIEMYKEMELIVGKDLATGSFAKSFFDIDDENTVESDDFGAALEEVSKGKQVACSSEVSSYSRSHKKRRRVEEMYDKLPLQIGEVASAINKLSEDRSVMDLYDEVMKTEGFDEVMLASAFDCLVENENVAKAFMAKNGRLRSLWLENFFRINA